MGLSNKINAYTSIPPKIIRYMRNDEIGFDYQRACIQSWSEGGLLVKSLNNREEVNIISNNHLDVEFIYSNYSRPLINELLDAARNSSTDIVGIINADCVLLDPLRLLKTALLAADKGLVICDRINISALSFLPTGSSCLGFDAFFFHKKFIENIQLDPQLKIGQPWWDYWFPAEFVMNGVPLFRLEAPILFHLDHEQKWQQEEWEKMGKEFLNRLEERKYSGHCEEIRSIASLINSCSEKDFGIKYFQWIMNKSKILKSKGGFLEKIKIEMINQYTNFSGMHEAAAELIEISRLRHYEKDRENLIEAHASAERHAHYLEKLLTSEKVKTENLESDIANLAKEISLLRGSGGLIEWVKTFTKKNKH